MLLLKIRVTFYFFHSYLQYSPYQRNSHRSQPGIIEHNQ